MALAGNVEDTPLTEEDLPLEILRNDLWARLHDFDRWAEVLERVISEALPLLKSDTDWTDIEKVIQDSVGITADQFRALTAANGLIAYGDRLGYIHPRYTNTSHLTKAVADKWTAFYTSSIESAREAATDDLTNLRYWSFTAFYDRPLLKINDERLLLVRPWFLMIKATPIGFFSDVERMLREGGKRGSTTAWARLFGKSCEIFGRQLILDNIGTNVRVMIDEPKIRAAWGGEDAKTCDVVLINEDWLVLDFVFHRIKKETATSGSLNDLASDIEKTVVGKLEQIDATLERGLGYESPNGAIYPLVVVGAPFSSNGATLNMIDEMAEQAKLKIVGEHDKCRQPMIIDLEEFWLLLELAKNERVFPTKLIQEWIDSPMRVASFRNWSITSGRKLPPSSGRSLYATNSMQQLFGRAV